MGSTLILIGRIHINIVIIIFIIITFIPQRQTNRIIYVGKFTAVLLVPPNQKRDSRHFNKAKAPTCMSEFVTCL